MTTPPKEKKLLSFGHGIQHVDVACPDGHSSKRKHGKKCNKVVGYTYHCRDCGQTQRTDATTSYKHCPNCGSRYGRAKRAVRCGKTLALQFD